MAGAQQKTEKPTARRLDKARKEGQFPVSRELIAAFHFMAALAMLDWTANAWLANTAAGFETLLADAFRSDLTNARFRAFWFLRLAPALAPLGLAAMALASLAALTQLVLTGFSIATACLRPAWSRLNPGQRLSELASNGPVSAAKGLVLICAALLVLSWIIEHRFLETLELLRLPARAGLSVGWTMIRGFVWQAAFLFLVLGLADWSWQRYRFLKSMRMSKQDIRDEAKESDGSPETKGRIRRMQRELARRNMMQDVPKATAVIVNPTHFAVAIRYSVDSIAAPTVIAKGKNYLAMRIRERAVAGGVPIVENAPLAQALYKSVGVGQEIPPHLYRAVAEILAYIYKLMNGRLPG